MKEIIPSIGNLSYGVVDNINTEFKKKWYSNRYSYIAVKWFRNSKKEKLEIVNIQLTSNIRTVAY